MEEYIKPYGIYKHLITKIKKNIKIQYQQNGDKVPTKWQPDANERFRKRPVRGFKNYYYHYLLFALYL